MAERRPRVLHLTPLFPPAASGIADYAGWLTAELTRLGLDVRVCTDLSRVAGEVGEFRPDVLHVHYQESMYGGRAAAGYLPWTLALRGRRPKIVTTLHDMRPPSRPVAPLGRLAFEALLFGSDRIIVSGEAERRGVSRRPGLAARTVMVPIGSNIAVTPVGDARRRELRGLSGGRFRLVYFGLIRPGKGLEVLLPAVARLRGRVEVVIAGEVGEGGGAYREQLVAKVKELGLEDSVSFVGRLPEAQVSETLQVADAAVLPFEGGASTGHTSVFAAMAHGLPVITTRGAGTPDLLTQGALELVPAPPQTAELAAAIERLMDDPGRRQALAAAGQALADRFSHAAIASRIASVYAELAPRGSVN